MPKNEKTSRKMATLAGKALRSKRSSKTTKSLAGSTLTQAPARKPRKKR